MRDKYERTKSADYLSAIFMLSWGLLLLVPMDTFSSAPAYRLLEAMAPESRWATVAILLAIFQMISLHSHRCAFGREGRIIANTASVLWWGMLAVLSFHGNPYGHGWVMYGCLCATMVYSLHHITARDSHAHPKRQRPDGQSHKA